MTKMNRREFVQATAAAATVPTALFGQAPTVMTPKSVKPIVMTTASATAGCRTPTAWWRSTHAACTDR
ncbi:MAG: hypothetical protein AUI11_10710 [Acidobacteria bacterium 13_2_20CM_2_66_4]|nr:MAG: hypothetical protein AUI11_10710 [Acidobacteria bacterium 13_2_20CM_2_66_4]